MKDRLSSFGCRGRWLLRSGWNFEAPLIRQMSGGASESSKDELLRSGREERNARVPLKDVVADCERRWFEAALKAAKSGDVAMQNLVGHMFSSGYGVAADKKRGKHWLQKSADAGDDDSIMSLSRLSVGETVNMAGTQQSHTSRFDMAKRVMESFHR